MSTRIFSEKEHSSILLIIAHPDDEIMFFSPLLTTLSERKVYNNTISVLCLSTGNAEGLGNIRIKELKKCCSLFRIEAEQVFLVDHVRLQDGMHTIWPEDIVSDIIIQYIHLTKADIIVSFDKSGVSNHPNHIAVFRGLQVAYKSIKEEQPNLVALTLESKNCFRKFSGIFEIIFTFFLKSDLLIFSFASIIYAWRGIHVHKTQNVWYRRIFILLSSYSYVNSFNKISAYLLSPFFVKDKLQFFTTGKEFPTKITKKLIRYPIWICFNRKTSPIYNAGNNGSL